MEYTIQDGKVLRDGAEVAVLNEDNSVKEYLDEGKKYRLPISKKLKEFFSGEETVPTWEQSVSEAFPDAPIGNPKLGDKDPDLVRWLYANHVEDFEHRYKGRKTVIDQDKPQEESDTKKAVRAQKNGFDDANDRRGFRPEFYGWEGIFKSEYKVGYINGGGRI